MGFNYNEKNIVYINIHTHIHTFYYFPYSQPQSMKGKSGSEPPSQSWGGRLDETALAM